MSAYLFPIQTAIILFPFLAALITLPYVIQQYRHYGAILAQRVVVIYSFIFYLLCCYFLVVLPLPPIEDVAQYTTPIMQLSPFHALQDLSLSSPFIWDDPSTYWSALNEPNLLQVLFNIAMTIPFGLYLRYYFQCGWKKTLLFSFLLTMSFESLQLSGLLGIYPRPYRLFDVDDLITNTLGGMIGYAITPALVHYLPSRKQLDKEAYEKGLSVSSFRRLFAFFTDIILVLILSFFAHTIIKQAIPYTGYVISAIKWYIAYTSMVVIYYFMVPIILKGQTLGKRLVKIRLQKPTIETPKWYQYITYYFVLYLLILPAPFLLFILIIELLSISIPYETFIIIAGIIYFIAYLIGILLSLVSLFAKDYVPWFRCKLLNYSTIEHVDEDIVDTNQIIDEDVEEVQQEAIEDKVSIDKISLQDEEDTMLTKTTDK